MELDISHPLSLGMCPYKHVAQPAPKIHLQEWENKIMGNPLKNIKSDKAFDKLTLGNSKFIKCEVNIFISPVNSVSMIYLSKC